MHNTKRKINVAELIVIEDHDDGTEIDSFYEIRRNRTVWQCHTGAECIKQFGRYYRIRPESGLPGNATHRVGEEYVPPLTAAEVEKQLNHDCSLFATEISATLERLTSNVRDYNERKKEVVAEVARRLDVSIGIDAD